MRPPARNVGGTVVGACLVLLLGSLFLSAQESGTGYLRLRVCPSVAGVFVDGKYEGPAANFGVSRKYAIAAGEHEITLSDPRYQDFSSKVKIEAGKTTTYCQSLLTTTLPSPPFGTLRVEGGSSKFDGVFVNGKFAGHIGEFNNVGQGLLLNPGEYTLKIVSPGGNQESEEKVRIEGNKTTRVRVGSVAVNSGDSKRVGESQTRPSSNQRGWLPPTAERGHLLRPCSDSITRPVGTGASSVQACRA